MLCALCETHNPVEVADCSNCGKQLHADARVLELVRPLEGLEETLRDPLESGVDPDDRMPELEQTQIASRTLRIVEERVPNLELTPIEADAAVPSSWTAGRLELESGREVDEAPRTPAPVDQGACPWCGAQANGAVCDSCGRRRSRYTEAAQRTAGAANDETVLCPACFARVAADARCAECGVRLNAP
jgi:hypothetical protein